MRKTSLASIALVCLVVLSLVYGLATITVCRADNSMPYYEASFIEPQDNSMPYYEASFIEPQDNSMPYFEP